MKFKVILLLVVFSVAISSLVLAEEKGSTMDGAMDAMMEKMVAYATPGDNHKALESLIGKWDHTVEYWMSGASEPEVSTGVSETKWVLGERFVQQSVIGEAMGSKFEGLGIIGYDNLTKKYNTIWLDSMGTGIMKANGTLDNSTNKLSENGNFSCPLTGGTRNYRAITTFIDENKYTYETYMTDENGKEFRAMLITYQRVTG